MADFMAGMDPFLIFPEEVWDLILDQVEDSQDAWNLLKAFPQLDASVALQKKKRFWLFGLVIPHLIHWNVTSWIKEKELLNCRQVCKPWSTAVDGFLEGQPQLRAYHPESQGQEVAQLVGSGRFHWNVKTHLSALWRQQDTYLGGTGFIFRLGGILRRMVQEGGLPIKRFLQDMEGQPPWRNPFLSRALSISSYVWEREQDELEEGKQGFLTDVLTLHQKFGEHVSFYKLEVELDSLEASFVAQYLSHLPNLKLLHVAANDGTFCPNDVLEFMDLLGRTLPPLPFLESLRMDEFCPEYLSHFLISRFSAQIRRLDLLLELWREEYYDQFPNLTELDLTDRAGRPDGNELGKILLSLEAPQLAKLQVNFPEVDEDCTEPDPFVFVMEDVFQWLKRFPNLKFLDLGHRCRGTHSIEKETLTPENDSIRSLQYLAIRPSFKMNYNFLRCLPSLQHIQLYVSSKPVVIDLSTNPWVRIREEIQTASMYKSNIWKLLPKLKSVTLAVEWESIPGSKVVPSYAFSRERYEFERRLSTKSSVEGGEDDDDALAPLRKDIIAFLQEELERGNELDSDEMDYDLAGQEESEESDMDEGGVDLNLEDDRIDEDEERQEELEDEDRL